MSPCDACRWDSRAQDLLRTSSGHESLPAKVTLVVFSSSKSTKGISIVQCSAVYPLVSSYNTAHARPTQDKSTQRLRKQASTEPNFSPRTTTIVPPFAVCIQTPRPACAGEVFLRLAACKEEVEECGDQHIRKEVEGEPVE